MEKQARGTDAKYTGINLSELRPGTVITDEKLDELWEKNTGRKTPKWVFLQNLRHDITTVSFKNGTPIVVHQVSNDLVLDHGHSAASYLNDRVEAGGRTIARAAVMLDAFIETAGMTDEEKEEYERWKIQASDQVASLIEARRKHKLIGGFEMMACFRDPKKDLPNIE